MMDAGLRLAVMPGDFNTASDSAWWTHPVVASLDHPLSAGAERGLGGSIYTNLRNWFEESTDSVLSVRL